MKYRIATLSKGFLVYRTVPGVRLDPAVSDLGANQDLRRGRHPLTQIIVHQAGYPFSGSGLSRDRRNGDEETQERVARGGTTAVSNVDHNNSGKKSVLMKMWRIPLFGKSGDLIEPGTRFEIS